MVLVIRLRKFSFRSLIKYIIATLACLVSAAAFASMPMVSVRTVGVIPPQTKHLSSAKDLAAASKHCVAAFPKVVREAKRFLVLDDDFVANMWSTAETRKDLVDDYELDAFVTLDIQLKNDTVLWYARLLSPRMETYLIESESMSRSAFSELNASASFEKLQELVFRTFNRLPIDATVTSIQSKFLTLSAGKEQGINNKDEYSVVRPGIAATHPATGAWLSFNNTVLGKIKIVEVKDNSSIAEITHMTHDNSMMIGDGIKISDLNSRLRFKRRASESPTSATDIKSQPASPIYSVSNQTQVPAEKTTSENVPATDTPEHSTINAERSPDSEFVESSSNNTTKILREIIDYGSASAGFKLWNASGAATAVSSFFPLNFGQVDVGRKFGADSALEAGGHFSFGGTKNGSFTGFGGYGRISYQQPLTPDLNWSVGGGGGLNSLAVEDELFGGYDAIYAAGFASLMGQVRFEDQAFSWRTDLELRPFNIGQVGAKGAKKQIDSSLVTIARLGISQNLGTDQLEWGGGFESQTANFSLGQSDLTLSDMSFNASARIRF
jgi:hypothetical protein